MTKIGSTCPQYPQSEVASAPQSDGVLMTEKPDLLDMEDAVRGSREMADVVFTLAEMVAVHGSTERDLNALVRCASVLQEYTTRSLEQWEAARQAQAA